MAARHSAASKQRAKRGGSLLLVGALPLSVALWQMAPAGAAPTEAAAPATDSGATPLAGPVTDIAGRVLPAAVTSDPGFAGAAGAVDHALTQAAPGPWQFVPSAATDAAVAPIMDTATAPDNTPAVPGPTEVARTVVDGARAIADPAPAAGPEVSAPAAVARNAAEGMRAVPDLAAPAMVDPGALHLPDPAHLAPEVAPIQAPEGMIRIGSVQTQAPGFIDPQTTAQINDSAAQAEADLARGLDSAGFEPSRSDRIAADTLGGAVVGASVGNIVSSPIASTSALVGGVAGLVAGIPFLPAGLVVMPVVGAAIGYAVIAAPAAAAGAAVGAGVGAIEGAVAPGVPAPAAPAAPDAPAQM